MPTSDFYTCLAARFVRIRRLHRRSRSSAGGGEDRRKGRRKGMRRGGWMLVIALVCRFRYCTGINLHSTRFFLFPTATGEVSNEFCYICEGPTFHPSDGCCCALGTSKWKSYCAEGLLTELVCVKPNSFATHVLSRGLHKFQRHRLQFLCFRLYLLLLQLILLVRE